MQGSGDDALVTGSVGRSELSPPDGGAAGGRETGVLG